MFYSLKKDCYFRKYGEVGYITYPCLFVDEIVDKVGAIFLEQLDYEFKSIDEVIGKLLKVFELVDINDLRSDVINFYEHFYNTGFLNKCEIPENFNELSVVNFTLNDSKISKESNSFFGKTTSEFFSDYAKEHPFLGTLHIEVTSKCNERCIHCYIPHEIKNKEIDYDLIINIIEQCRDMGVMTIVLSGGEPMLYPYFSDVLKRIKDYDMNVVVLSNLTLLNNEIIKALQYRHTTCVNVSLYSMDANIHESITMLKGSFEKTRNNILKLVDNNIPVQINCPIMKQNKNNFSDVVRWGHKLKCNVQVDYLIMAKNDGSKDNLDNRLSVGEIKDVIKSMIDNNENLQQCVVNEELKLAKKRNCDDQVCGAGLMTLSVDSQGNVYPCVGWQKCICGNVKDTMLKEIWEHSKELSDLRKLRFGDFFKCANCEDVQYCSMCMCMNANESVNGDVFDIPKITCEAAKIYHKIIEEYCKKNRE